MVFITVENEVFALLRHLPTTSQVSSLGQAVFEVLAVDSMVTGVAQGVEKVG